MGLGLRSPVFCLLIGRLVGPLPWEVESQPWTALFETEHVGDAFLGTDLTWTGQLPTGSRVRA